MASFHIWSQSFWRTQTKRETLNLVASHLSGGGGVGLAGGGGVVVVCVCALNLATCCISRVHFSLHFARNRYAVLRECSLRDSYLLLSCMRFFLHFDATGMQMSAGPQSGAEGGARVAQASFAEAAEQRPCKVGSLKHLASLQALRLPRCGHICSSRDLRCQVDESNW